MKYFILPSLCLLICLSANAQEPVRYRSDTISASLLARVLFVTNAIGLEVPVKQHSYGLLLGQYILPENWDLSNKIFLATEYKRYYSSKAKPGNQHYLGSYLLFMHTAHATPEEENGDWVRSRSYNLGPIWGWKWYPDNGGYLELYVGTHAGIRLGTKRWDIWEPDTGQHNRYSEDAKAFNYGIRLGINAGIQFKRHHSR